MPAPIVEGFINLYVEGDCSSFTLHWILFPKKKPYTGFSPESRVKKDLTYIGFNLEGTGL